MIYTLTLSTRLLSVRNFLQLCLYFYVFRFVPFTIYLTTTKINTFSLSNTLLHRISYTNNSNPHELIHFDYFYSECVCVCPMWNLVNGIGAPGVMPPFALGLGTPLTTNAYGNAIPSLGAFTLATTTGMGQTNQSQLRGISNVLLVSNLNEEVSSAWIKLAFLLNHPITIFYSSTHKTIFSLSLSLCHTHTLNFTCNPLSYW